MVIDRQAGASIPGRCGVAATMARLPPLLRPVLASSKCLASTYSWLCKSFYADAKYLEKLFWVDGCQMFICIMYFGMLMQDVFVCIGFMLYLLDSSYI